MSCKKIVFDKKRNLKSCNHCVHGGALLFVSAAFMYLSVHRWAVFLLYFLFQIKYNMYFILFTFTEQETWGLGAQGDLALSCWGTVRCLSSRRVSRGGGNLPKSSPSSRDIQQRLKQPGWKIMSLFCLLIFLHKSNLKIYILCRILPKELLRASHLSLLILPPPPRWVSFVVVLECTQIFTNDP